MRRDVLTAMVCLLVTSICPAQPGATGGESLSPSIGFNPVDNSSLLGGDVGVDSIICPRGAVDSGQQVTPRVVVANYGSNPESLVVKMAIDRSGVEQYSDSLTIGSLQPGAYDTIEFGRWIPDGRDSMTATAWTECAGDTFPLNDTAQLRFMVRVRSGRISDIIVPSDTLDSGVVIYPRCRVWNDGNQDLHGVVHFRIIPDSFYFSAREVWLIAGGARLVTAPDSWVAKPGQWTLLCSLIIVPDTFLDAKSQTFCVLGTEPYDVGCSQILAPTRTIDTGVSVTPTGRLQNYGPNAETFWTWFHIWDSTCTAVYNESTQVMIAGEDSFDVQFTPDWVTYAGNFTTRCSTFLVGDQNGLNDVMRGQLWVYMPRGIDVGVDTVVLGQAGTVAAIHNYSAAIVSGGVFMTVTVGGVQVYGDSMCLTNMLPYVVDTVSFSAWIGDSTFELVVWIVFPGDTYPANDTFRVLGPVPGVEQVRELAACNSHFTATVVRGVLRLTPAASLTPQATNWLLDAAGRKVLGLKPGANDVRHLPAGIYFVRAVSCKPSAVSCQKVVIQR